MSADSSTRRYLRPALGDRSLARQPLRVGTVVPVGSRFVPIVPYRTADSRPLRFNSNQTLDHCVLNDLTGAPMIPDEAVAVSGIFTIDQTVDQGFIGVFPAGTTWQGNSTINWWRSGLTLANNGVVALGVSPTSGPGSVTMISGGGGKTAVLADITGYYV